MPDLLMPYLTVLVTLALGILTWLASRRSGDRSRIESLETRLDKVDGRNAKMQDYIGDLRQHINAGNPPPPPSFPPNLFD